MGIKYGQGRYYGTRGSIVQTYYTVSTKREARSLTPLLPTAIQSSAKRFFGGRNEYDSFSVSQDTAGRYILVMEKPGNVPGSRAIYFKITDSNEKTVGAYKETYDPAGNLVHTKTKREMDTK
jgi:hypothetical protein